MAPDDPENPYRQLTSSKRDRDRYKSQSMSGVKRSVKYKAPVRNEDVESQKQISEQGVNLRKKSQTLKKRPLIDSRSIKNPISILSGENENDSVKTIPKIQQVKTFQTGSKEEIQIASDVFAK